MASRHFSSTWSRFFGLTPAEQHRSAPPPPRPPTSRASPRSVSRAALEVEWLLRCLPHGIQAALRPDLLALKRTRVFVGALPVDDYTWPDVPGVRRPCYASGVLKMKTLEGLCARPRDELSLSVTALCAPEYTLPRPMRNALLVMQGRRLGQVSEMLEQHLHPHEMLLAFRQELAALG